MNLVKFLVIGALLSLVFGEFGKFPFGSSSSGALTITDILVGLAGLTFIIWKILNKAQIKLNRSIKWLKLFWMISGLSLGLSLLIYPFNEVLSGSLYLIRFIFYSGLMIIIFNLRRDGLWRFQDLQDLLIKVGLLLGTLGILQYIFIPDFEGAPFYLTEYGFDPHKYRLTSTFLDPNFFGVFLVILFFVTLISFINKKNKIKGVLLILFLIEIVLTYSRTAYLMFFVSGVILFFKNWQNFTKSQIIKIGFGLLISSIILSTLSPRMLDRVIGAVTIDQSSKERIESWGKGWEIFKLHPLLGVGFNNTRQALQESNLLKVYSEEGGHSGGGIDSSFIFVLVTTGVIGFFIYFLFWLQIIRKLWLVKKLEVQVLVSSIIGLGVSSQFINALFFPSLMVLIFSLVGILYSEEIE